MELSTVLLVLTALALLIAGVRLVRAPARQVADWWLTFAVVLSIALTAYFLAPTSAGYVAFSALVGLVFAPLRIDRAAQRSARAGNDRSAYVLARLAALLHPFGPIGARPTAFRALAQIRATGTIDQTMLERLGATQDPLIGEWYRLLALHAAADADGVRAALAIPSRRARMLQLGLGAAFVRAVAATGDKTAILEAIEEAERHDVTLDDPDRRSLLALEACAALGDVEGVHTIGADLVARVPRGTIARAIAAAERAAGEIAKSRKTIDAALATDVDPSIRRSLERLRERPTTSGPIETASLKTRVANVLDRVRREAHASAALAPLADGGASPSYATWTLAGAIVAWYLVIAANGDTTNADHLARMGGLILPIEGWQGALRLFSAAFVHYGVLHLVFNLYALVAFGRFVEAFYGRLRFVLIWIAATLTSGLAVAYAGGGDAHVLVGASGAIFGLGGALVSGVGLSSELRKSKRGREELKSFAILVGIQMLFDRLVPRVSGTAHIAGLIGGVLAGAVLLRRVRAGALRPTTNRA
ncbi:MAG: rhomboid family intramembrane serine protease [Polyangiales bacterium]